MLSCGPEGLETIPNSLEDACASVNCGLGAECLVGECSCTTGLYGDPNVECETIQPHLDWIGAPCIDDFECAYDGGFCVTEEDGFSSGYCTAPCEQYCDDLADMPMTFCVGEPDFSEGRCVSRCDLGYYPLTDGCRPNYACVERYRNTGEVTEFVCLPS
jgi:hypothetical protein